MNAMNLLPLVLSAVLISACGGCQSQAQPQRISGLAEAQRQKAIRIADDAVKANKLMAAGPIYVVNVERLHDKSAEGTEQPDQKALVTHYRYEGDMTIQTIVNLDRDTAEHVQTATHVGAPLSAAEFQTAKQLALNDQAVRAALGADADRVVVEPLVLRAASQQDPLFGHRVVRLLFRVGRNYKSAPIVNVDLTDRRVIVEQPRAAVHSHPG